MCLRRGELRRAVGTPGFRELVDRVTSFEIFPTLLVAAGYDSAELRARYHGSLFDRDADRDERFFVSGNLFERGSPYQNQLVRRVARAYRTRFEIQASSPAP